MRPKHLLRLTAAWLIAGISLSACGSAGIEDAPQGFDASDAHPIPSETQALIEQGKTLIAQGAIEDANLILKRAVRYSDGDADAVGAFARSYLLLRRPSDALAEYDLALARDPNNPRWISGRGVALDQLGKHEEAQQAYQSALSLAPAGTDASANATINLALSLAISGDRASASQLLTDLAIDERYAVRARHNLAIVKALGGNTKVSAALLSGELDQVLAEKAANSYARLRTSKNPAREIPIR